METHKGRVQQFADEASPLVERNKVKFPSLSEKSNQVKAYSNPELELLPQNPTLQNSSNQSYTTKAIYDKHLIQGSTAFYTSDSSLHSNENESARSFYNSVTETGSDSKFFMQDKHLEPFSYSQNSQENTATFIDNFIDSKIPEKQPQFGSITCNNIDFQSKKLVENDSTLTKSTGYEGFASTSSASSNTRQDHKNESVSKQRYPVSSILPDIKPKQTEEEDWSKSEDSLSVDETTVDQESFSKNKKFKLEKEDVMFLDSNEEKSLKESTLEESKFFFFKIEYENNNF